MIPVFVLFGLLSSIVNSSTPSQVCAIAGAFVNGGCWYLAQFNSGTPDCDSYCSSISSTANTDLIVNYAGSGAASIAGCQAVVNAFGFPSTPSDATGSDCGNSGIGCSLSPSTSQRCTSPATTTNATATFFGGGGGRFCACNILSSSGGQDPHFHGYNGEIVDIVKDEQSSNKVHSVYCDEKILLNALFSTNPEGLLFMTEFYGRINEVTFHLKLGKYPLIYGHYFIDEGANNNRTVFVLENGVLESDSSVTIAKLDHLEFMINTAADVDGNVYFDIDIKPVGAAPIGGRKASGIIGRSFERAYSPEEFAEYHQFIVERDFFNTCGGADEFNFSG